MQEEIWKDIEGYEGLYMVSNMGRVKSLGNGGTNQHKGKIQILKNQKFNTGYLRVKLIKNGKQKHHLIHRLVAIAFLENPNNYKCVNHKDENKENNKASNLEFCNYKYNNTYGTRIKRTAKKMSKKINQYTLDGEFVREWESASEVERETGWFQGPISACCRGEQHKSYGYIWKYVA